MPHVIITGNLGRDAKYKTTQSSELCSFSVADEAGYGDSKQTVWFDVTRWGKGAQGLAGILRKGSKVTVIGELTTREHDGKTYLQCRADKVTIQSTPQGGNDAPKADTAGHAPNSDDLDDDIPF